MWQLTRYLLRDHATFDVENSSFFLRSNPFPGEEINPGPYRMGRRSDDANTYRVGHPLAQRVLAMGCKTPTPSAEVVFQYTGEKKPSQALEPLVGNSGWLRCTVYVFSAAEVEDHMFLAGVTDGGARLDEAQCRRPFDLPGGARPPHPITRTVAAALDEAIANRWLALLDEVSSRNSSWLDAEMDKLDRWADDRRSSLKAALKELDESLRAAKKAARLAPTLPEKLERQREARIIEGKRDEAWREFDQASRGIETKKDALLDEIGRRLKLKTEQENLFTIRWRMV